MDKITDASNIAEIHCQVLPLADGAKKAGALPLFDLFDGGAALSARLVGSAVHPVMLLEVSLFAIAINIVTQAAPAQRDGLVQRCPDFSRQSFAASPAEFSCGKLRFDAGAK